jgi:hypothetical protein
VKPTKKAPAQAQEQARRKAIIEEARQTVDRVNRLERKWKERRQLAPLTAEEFSRAFKKYFPAELQAPAAAFLLDMFAKAQRAGAESHKGKIGHPPGVGSKVEELMSGPFKWDQKTARRLVAADLCRCRDERGHPALVCTCRAYSRVADLHKQFLHDQRNPKPKRTRGAGKGRIG